MSLGLSFSNVWWDQSSWHRWAVTASTVYVVQLGAVADWWCSWPMPNTLCVLVFVPEADIFNILLTINLFHCTWWTLCFTPCLMQQVMFWECIIKSVAAEEGEGGNRPGRHWGGAAFGGAKIWNSEIWPLLAKCYLYCRQWYFTPPNIP